MTHQKFMTPAHKLALVPAINQAALNATEIANASGFNDKFHKSDCGKFYLVPIERLKNMCLAEQIALMHSELGEATEALRHGNPPDDKIPQHSGALAEFADTVIRILHACGSRNWTLGEAIWDKMLVNQDRPHKHGKKF